MLGTKQYSKQKQKTFTSDNERKRYFAIKTYYKNKNNKTMNVLKKFQTQKK